MFIKYEKSQAKKRIGKKIGFDKRGRIVFYKEAVPDLYCITNIELYFDAEANHIGIFPNCNSNDSFQVQGSKTIFISAKRFFNRFGIHPEGRFDYTVEDGMLVVQLPGDQK